MTEREFWRECSTGHVYAIELADGVVIGSCGPLTRSELETEFLPSFDYSRNRAAWIEAHRDAFGLYRPADVPALQASSPAERGGGGST